jgi:septum formation protein
MIKTKDKIILASGSSTRKMLLEQSGIDFKIQKSDLDEDLLKDEFIKEYGSIDPLKLGIKLAIAKATEISKLNPKAYVIGADQVCFMDGEIFDKPGSLDNCIRHLQKLRNKEHSQNCSCCIVKDSKVIWQYSEQALLKIKNLSDEEINIYVNKEKPTFACGSYMLENYGKHLFEYIEGDHDVVLGLPLIPLLNELHRLGLIEFSE